MNISHSRLFGLDALSHSVWFNFGAIIIGMAITYFVFQEQVKSLEGLELALEILLKGGFWGLFVGQSFAILIEEILSGRPENLRALGWSIVAVCYAIYMVYFYQGDPAQTFAEKVYWRVLGGALATLVVGSGLLGSYLMVKFGKQP
ncbi:MAG: hypothetical protein OEQ39_15110 [Gammaproteobacteria bacterium]|nr:hypothetical protein [Gammaproteobacteria bacterium]